MVRKVPTSRWRSRGIALASITGAALVTVTLVVLFSARSNQVKPHVGGDLFQSALASPLPTPLPSVTPTKVEPTPVPLAQTPTEAALAFLKEVLPTRSGQPQVLLTRSIKFKDYPSLGLGNFNPGPGFEDTPLELIFLKGDFDTTRYAIPEDLPFRSASYVAVVYDVEHKSVTHVTVSVSGDELKQLLEMAALEPASK